MKVRAMLDDYIAHHDLCPGATDFDVWQNKKWVEVNVDGTPWRVFPMFPVRSFLMKHDVHHMLTGYDTSTEGEAEIAAWELGSGGCAAHVFFWVDRIIFVLIGLLWFREKTLAAFRRGRGQKNLFSERVEDILECDLSELRIRLRLDD